MLKTQQKKLSGYALRDAGWEALVNNLGLVNATRFIMQSETGYGDYTKIRHRFPPFQGPHGARARPRELPGGFDTAKHDVDADASRPISLEPHAPRANHGPGRRLRTDWHPSRVVLPHGLIMERQKHVLGAPTG